MYSVSFHYNLSLSPSLSLSLSRVESEFRYARWKKAVQKSMNWETTEPISNGNGIALCDWRHFTFKAHSLVSSPQAVFKGR